MWRGVPALSANAPVSTLSYFPSKCQEKIGRTKRGHRSKIRFPVAPPGAMMSIGFDSDEIILEKVRERLRRMTDEELIRFGKDLRKLAENPFQRKLDEARAEWKRRRPSGTL